MSSKDLICFLSSWDSLASFIASSLFPCLRAANMAAFNVFSLSINIFCSVVSNFLLSSWFNIPMISSSLGLPLAKKYYDVNRRLRLALIQPSASRK